MAVHYITHIFVATDKNGIKLQAMYLFSNILATALHSLYSYTINQNWKKVEELQNFEIHIIIAFYRSHLMALL